MSFGSATITVPLKDIIWAYGETLEEAEEVLARGLLDRNLLGVEFLGVEQTFDISRQLWAVSIKALRWRDVERALAA